MNAKIDVSDVVLHTDRLTLRPWKQSDLDDFFEYASVDGVGQMAGWFPHESKLSTQIILNCFIEEKKTFALEYQGKVIGSIGIEEYKDSELEEYRERKGRALGFVLSKDYWGQGLMPEAVKRVIRYLFEEVHLDFISCSHYVDNQQSHRVQEKCGFKFLKDTSHTTCSGAKAPTKLNILTAEDYNKSK